MPKSRTRKDHGKKVDQRNLEKKRANEKAKRDFMAMLQQAQNEENEKRLANAKNENTIVDDLDIGDIDSIIDSMDVDVSPEIDVNPEINVEPELNN